MELMRNTTMDRLFRLLLTPKEAAVALGVCEKTLWSLTDPRGPIACVRIGRAVRYDPADLTAWIESVKSGGPQSEIIKSIESGG